jgi:hypothetical protein
MNNEWLKTVKAGDHVFVALPYGGGYDFRKVARTTETRILTESKRQDGTSYETAYRRVNGFPVGGGMWEQSFLVQPTPEIHARVRLRKSSIKACALCDLLKMRMPKDQASIDRIIEALNAVMPPKPEEQR